MSCRFFHADIVGACAKTGSLGVGAVCRTGESCIGGILHQGSCAGDFTVGTAWGGRLYSCKSGRRCGPIGFRYADVVGGSLTLIGNGKGLAGSNCAAVKTGYHP